MLEKYKFPGPGQTAKYVLSLSECVELMGSIPGPQAKQFRKQSAHLLTRLFAGDPTLHDVIEKNGLSDGLMHQAARAELASQNTGVGMAVGKEVLLVKDKDELAMEKKIKMAKMTKDYHAIMLETSTIKLQESTIKLQESTIEHKACALELSRYTLLLDFEKTVHNYSVLGPVACKMLENRRMNKILTMSDNLYKQGGGAQLLLENGNSTSDRCFVMDIIERMEVEGTPEALDSLAMAAGRITADSFRMKYPGQEPKKQERMVGDDRVEVVCSYATEDEEMVEEAINTAIERRDARHAKAALKRKINECEKNEEESNKKSSGLMMKFLKPNKIADDADE
jgi:hypothetical protein